jgi:NAD(P)-dependent dehydrogenase (short-subunit alcohol dehydrogenase family)
MKLNNKVAFISDGANKTGVRIASLFESEGATVIRNIFPGDASGSGALIVHADPLSKEQIEESIKTVLDRYGRIDIFVHNNNEVIPASLEDCTDEAYDRAVQVNMRSAFYYVRAIGPAMKKARQGAVVFVSSIHDEKPGGGAFAYSVAKGAVKMFAKEMVNEFGQYNIRTNLVSSGPLEGEEKLFYSRLSPLYEYTAERISNHKPGKNEDIAKAVLYFAGDDGDFTNGAELRLDGGFLMTYFQSPVSSLPIVK